MSNYQPGDRVRILTGALRGQIGSVVESAFGHEKGYIVKPDESEYGTLWYGEDEIEPVEPEPKFKEGDRVITRVGSKSAYNGLIGTLEKNTDKYWDWGVRVKGREELIGYQENELELLSPAPDRLAEWEVGILLFGTKDQDSVYEQVAKSHGFIPLEPLTEEWTP